MKLDEQRKLHAREGLKALFAALQTDRKLFVRSLILLVIEGLVAATIPMAKSWLVEDPSMHTIFRLVLIQTLQVYFTVWFYNHSYVLEAAMSVHLSSQVLDKVVQMSDQQHAELESRWGKLHSSVFTKLVIGYGRTIPQITVTVWIITCHVAGLTIAFGWKYMCLVLGGIVVMCWSGKFALEENRHYSVEVKSLDVLANKRSDSLNSQFSVFRTTGTGYKKFDSVKQVFMEIKEFQQSVLWKRNKNSLFVRILPSKIATLLILLLALSENRSPAEFVMIEATLFTIMTMAFSSLQLLLNVSHLEGERIQIGATLATPPAPDGSTTITSCQQVSLMVERVELPNKRVLFSQGLFPNQPEKALQIHAGEFVAFIGPSGCGKTTVTNILSLKYEQQVELTDSPKWYGTYRMKTDVGDVAVADVSHKSLWTVLFPAPQRTDWVDGTVKENIELHLDNEGFSLDFSPWIRDVFVHEAAGLVDMSPEKLTQTVASLSGGEASRVMLARCLMGALICAYQGVSCVLILDETLSQLDEETAFEVRDRLQELQKYGVAIIMISHNKKLIPVDATVYRFAKDGAGIIECSRGSDFQ